MLEAPYGSKTKHVQHPQPAQAQLNQRFVSSDGEVRHVLRIRLRLGQIGAYILRTAFLNVRIAEAVLAYEDKDDGQSQ